MFFYCPGVSELMEIYCQRGNQPLLRGSELRHKATNTNTNTTTITTNNSSTSLMLDKPALLITILYILIWFWPLVKYSPDTKLQTTNTSTTNTNTTDSNIRKSNTTHKSNQQPPHWIFTANLGTSLDTKPPWASIANIDTSITYTTNTTAVTTKTSCWLS